MQPLRLLQHLSVAATKLPQHPVGYMRDALSWVTEGPPQGLQCGKEQKKKLITNINIKEGKVNVAFSVGYYLMYINSTNKQTESNKQIIIMSILLAGILHSPAALQ